MALAHVPSRTGYLSITLYGSQKIRGPISSFNERSVCQSFVQDPLHRAITVAGIRVSQRSWDGGKTWFLEEPQSIRTGAFFAPLITPSTQDIFRRGPWGND